MSPSGKTRGHEENGSARVAHPHGRTEAGVECPPGLGCQFLPAAYAENSSPSDYGNYDLADRPADGLAIRYVVVHDTEEDYNSTVAEFQDSHAYASAHYVIRSSDGFVTQMVPTKDVAWHAGNWYVNTHSVGVENEGFALDGAKWFTPKLYSSLARLTRYQAQRFGFPLDRAHVIGHDQVPGPSDAYQAGIHWDPGTYFNWAHLMALLDAPIRPSGNPGTDPVVTIDPNWETNQPTVTGCDGGTARCPKQPANFVYLHSAPNADNPARLRSLPGGGRCRAGRRRNDARLGLGTRRRWRAVRRRRPAGRLARGLVPAAEGLDPMTRAARTLRRSRARGHSRRRRPACCRSGLRRGASVELLDGLARQVLDPRGPDACGEGSRRR